MSTQAEPRDRGLDRGSALAARFLLYVAAGAVAAILLLQLWVVVGPLILALFLTAILTPLSNALRDRGLSRGLAAALSLLLGVAVLTAIIALTLPAFVAQAPEMARSVSTGVDQVVGWAKHPPLSLSPEQVAEVRRETDRGGSDSLEALKTGLTAGIPIVTSVVATLLLGLAFTLHLLKDGDRMWAWLLDLAPRGRQAMAGEIAHGSWTTLIGYVRGTAMVAAFDAVLIALGFWAIGVPLVIPIAVLVFFGAFIPIVGATLAGAVGVLIALADGGIQVALLALLVVLAVQQLEGLVVYPLAVGRAVSLHPFVVLGAFAAGTSLAGVVGGVLSVPLVAVVAGALARIRELRLAERSSGDASTAVAEGREPAGGKQPAVATGQGSGS